MSATTGKFVWYDVMTTDDKAAASFYGKVIGWEARDSGIPGRSYTILSMGSSMVGGLMPIPAEAAGAQPAWMGYIGVHDVDAHTSRVEQAGGAIHRNPEDIPGVGRFAVVADPQGAVFVLFQALNEQQPPDQAPNLPGRIGWHELHAADMQSDFAFYSDLFGWTKGEAMDMGPMGVYQMFLTGGEWPVGGMMTKMPNSPTPFWLYYFNVESIDAAVDRTKQSGGQLLSGPHQVPGGLWVAQCTDPQGAMFAMVAPQR
jgi:predicted enzyme related to lactoylglutathione lyase